MRTSNLRTHYTSSLSLHPDQFWNPPSLLPWGYSNHSIKLIKHPYLVPRFRISGAIPPLTNLFTEQYLIKHRDFYLVYRNSHQIPKMANKTFCCFIKLILLRLAAFHLLCNKELFKFQAESRLTFLTITIFSCPTYIRKKKPDVVHY
jgi:hypothetical protein